MLKLGEVVNLAVRFLEDFSLSVKAFTHSKVNSYVYTFIPHIHDLISIN